MQFRNITLVSAESRSRREAGEAGAPMPSKFDRQIQRALADPQLTAVPSTAGVLFEELLRFWLSRQFPLVGQRALRFELYDRSYHLENPESDGYRIECHEVDAIVGRDDQPLVLFEMRASCRWSSQRDVSWQLAHRLNIARARWHSVAGATIVVKTGPWRYKRHPKRLVRDMEINKREFWRCIENGEEPKFVFKLAELKEYAASLGIEFDTAFLRELNGFAARNFMRRNGELPFGVAPYGNVAPEDMLRFG